ncbi:Secretion protein HlyD [Rivularia sp. IAM M-261]|nr:Secretion protein HlyD [Rivularia sp. IAM M-261]
MIYQKRTLFRQESLDRLASPEKLDQLMKVVGSKSWLTLFALGSLVAVGAVWSVYGRIPVTVEGQGVLIYPRKVAPLEATTSGMLQGLHVKVGDTVRKGQIIATLDQSEVQRQLQQQQNKLTQLRLQEQAAISLQKMQTQQEKNSIQQQRLYLQTRIRETQSLTPMVKNTNNNTIKVQRLSLQQRIKEAQALTPTLKQTMDIRKKLFHQERAITIDVALDAEQKYLANTEKILELQSQLKDLDVKEAEQEKTYRESMTTITELQAQLKRLDSDFSSNAQRNLDDANNRRKEIQEQEREIIKFEQQIRNNRQIVSQHSGRILELTISPGQLVNSGVRIGNIDKVNPGSKLVSVTYFPVAEGKKIQPGMRLQITPQTVKRERFGGISGTVTSVSSFPVTKEEANSVVGNSELVEGIVGQQQKGVIQVFAELDTDSTTPSGYKWSSSNGPALKLSSGTTATARVKVEESSPISYVLPILRSVSGAY